MMIEEKSRYCLNCALCDLGEDFVSACRSRHEVVYGSERCANKRYTNTLLQMGMEFVAKKHIDELREQMREVMCIE